MAFRTGRLHEVGPDVVEGFASVRGRGHLVRRRGIEAQEGLGLAAQVGEHPGEASPSPCRRACRARRGSCANGDLEREAEALGQLFQRLAHQARPVPLPGMDRSVDERFVLVGDDPPDVHVPARAQPFAQRAGAVGAVEGEGARAQLGERDVAPGAGQLPAVEPLLFAHRDHHHVAGQVQRLVQGEDEPLLRPRSQGEAVDEDLDPVVAAGIEGDALFEADHSPVHADAQVPFGGQRRELLAESPLATADDRRQHRDRAGRGQLPEFFRDLLRGLGGHGPLALGAVRAAQGGKEDAEMVVDLGNGAHGGARMADRRPLLDGDGGAEPGDGLHVRLLHLVQELAGVGGKALDVAPLAFGVEGVEGQAALPGPRRPGDHDQAVPGYVAVHPLQVVDSRAADRDRFVRRWLQPGSC